ncbi:MAG TPA: ABC transporter substrate-binding protein [Longimicrobiales bacterium]|nr:ABC transporter substrate-binding protein [Longimicrobiales bacterium]
MPRIVSFLPAGTEIVCALGAAGELVGRSHECDYPPEVQSLPVVSRPALRLEGLGQAEVDRLVAERLGQGGSLYEVDERLLRELRPDVILTQDLCQVCAPSGSELTRAVRALPTRPDLIWLSPQTVSGIEENIRTVGEAIGRAAEADALIRSIRDRIVAVRSAVAAAPRRRVVFLEWTDPPFCAGHWVPEMIYAAGGLDPLGRAGKDSLRITWEDVEAAMPEVILVAPCGYGLEASVELAGAVRRVRGARVVALDANAYFARPGPRVAEGVELLAHVLHPERFPWPHPHRPWAEVPPPPEQGGRASS